MRDGSLSLMPLGMGHAQWWQALASVARLLWRPPVPGAHGAMQKIDGIQSTPVARHTFSRGGRSNCLRYAVAAASMVLPVAFFVALVIFVACPVFALPLAVRAFGLLRRALALRTVFLVRHWRLLTPGCAWLWLRALLERHALLGWCRRGKALVLLLFPPVCTWLWLRAPLEWHTLLGRYRRG